MRTTRGNGMALASLISFVLLCGTLLILTALTLTTHHLGGSHLGEWFVGAAVPRVGAAALIGAITVLLATWQDQTAMARTDAR